MNTRYKNICDLFYSSHYISIAYYHKRKLSYSTGYPDIPLPYDTVLSRTSDSRITVDIYSSDPLGYYGIIGTPDMDDLFLIGPVFSLTISSQAVRDYMHELCIPLECFQTVFEFLRNIPLYSYNQFLHLTNFIYFVVNGKQTDIFEQVESDTPHILNTISQKYNENSYVARDEQIYHNTYSFEMQMMDYIRKGNREGLKLFLHSVGSLPLTEGSIADTPLRQAKNVFFGTVVQAGKHAAIPGGMNKEEAYQLIDVYAKECERMKTVSDISTLRYHMLLDFAERVGHAQIPADISSDVYECIQYINAHINEYIYVQDVADHIHRSRVYTIAKFKKELGFSIGQYITHAKLQEAKSLLLFTEKSLAEISSYLAFSSQAYFQNVFKKQYGITPTEYRKAKKTIYE